MNKIERKIVSVAVSTGAPVPTPPPVIRVVQQAPKLLEREEVLDGRTYKIKPVSSVTNATVAMYITINHLLIDADTPQQKWVPFEIFVNTKDNTHLEWVTAMTRLVSAVFRKGGDVSFIIEELASTFDTKGGYYAEGGRRFNSVTHQVGSVIKEHLKYLDQLNLGGVVSNVVPIVAVNAPQAADKYQVFTVDKTKVVGAVPQGEQCAKCFENDVRVLDGCKTCLSCGDSKCG